MTTETLPRPFNARVIYRWLYKRLRLPRPVVHGVLSAAKRATVTGQVRHRTTLTARLSAPAPDGLELYPDEGFRIFEPGELPGALETAHRCADLYRQYRDDGATAEALLRNPTKQFVLSVLAGNEFADHPELLRFMVSRPLLDAATRYLGTVPIVEGAALWWTRPNDTAVASQAWHIDELARRQVKILLNCTEVTEDQGPLHLLPADLSERLRREVGHRRGRFDDKWVEADSVRARMRCVTGPPGAGVIIDSSRCLHFGSRGNRRDRLVLTFHYLPLDAPTETRYNLRLSQRPAGLEGLDEYQRLALGLA